MKNAIQYPLLFIFCLLLTGVSLQGQRWGKKTITGEGPLVKKTLAVKDFDSFGLGMNATVYVKQGRNFRVEIEAQKNIIDALELEVEDGAWNAGFGDDTKARNYKKAKIWITMPTVRSLAIGGTGEIIGESEFKDLGDLKLSIAGSGEIDFSGDAKDGKLSIAGSGTIRGENLKMDNAKVNIAGSGKTYLHMNNGDLKVSIAGSGDVYYKGKANVSSSIAGSGRVKSM